MITYFYPVRISSNCDEEIWVPIPSTDGHSILVFFCHISGACCERRSVSIDNILVQQASRLNKGHSLS
ncbi:unnamed protein product [Brassica oleracea var. botrytis]